MIPPVLESITTETADLGVAADRPLGLIAELVFDDHEELIAEVARLRRLSVELAEGFPLAELEPAKLIEDFEETLVLHFAAEEAEELLASLATDQPSLLERAAHVQAEHGEILIELDCLLELAVGAAPARDLAGRLGSFLDCLDAHERAENCLMQDIVLLEGGGCG